MTQEHRPYSLRNVNSLMSDHAALRFLQRVRMTDIGHRDGLTDRGWLLRACEALRTTPEEIKASVLTPAVRAALAVGARRVAYESHVLIILKGADGNRFIASMLNNKQINNRFPKKARR